MSVCTCERIGPNQLLLRVNDTCPTHTNNEVCERCREEGHTEIDYDDCIMAHVPNSVCACLQGCMENYDPTDEQLFAYARSAVCTGGFR